MERSQVLKGISAEKYAVFEWEATQVGQHNRLSLCKEYFKDIWVLSTFKISESSYLMGMLNDRVNRRTEFHSQ